MTVWENGIMAKWHFIKMKFWENKNVGKWPFGKMAFWENDILENDILGKWHFVKMTFWEKITFREMSCYKNKLAEKKDILEQQHFTNLTLKNRKIGLASLGKNVDSTKSVSAKEWWSFSKENWIKDWARSLEMSTTLAQKANIKNHFYSYKFVSVIS